MAINRRCKALISKKKCEINGEQKLIFKGSLEYELKQKELDINIDM